MRTYEQQLIYERLELISSSKSAVEINSSPLVALLRTAWQRLIEMLSSDSDLRVWKVTDPSGTSWWQVYDPMTKSSVWLASRSEVMAWLEKRYY